MIATNNDIKIGDKYGALTVICISEDRPGYCTCRCDCGNEIELLFSNLIRGHNKSCGCLKHRVKSPDITGMRSGMVTAIERTDEKRRGVTLWRCRCDCGKEFLTEGYKISSQTIQSCGCLRNVKKIKDLTGMKFGRLTAVRRLDKKIGSSFAWQCICDCGNEVTASANALLMGRNTSCGCATIERMKSYAKDITNQRFGRLVALYPTDKRVFDSVLWHCKCDCGNEIDIPLTSLNSGNSRSCGCMLKDYAKNELRENLHYIDKTCIEMIKPKKLRSDNTSGHTGVVAMRNKWHAQICFKGKNYHLGTYEKIEDAIHERELAEEKKFGEFLEWYESQKKENEEKATHRATTE